MAGKMRNCLLSVMLWVWTGTLYFFMEVILKTAQGRPESISWTMLALATVLAIPLDLFGAPLYGKLSLPVQSLICALLITAAEFAAGLILNVHLGLGIWDYSDKPGNLMGQVCPQFFIIWIFLSAAGIVMLDWMRYIISGGQRPRYTFI